MDVTGSGELGPLHRLTWALHRAEMAVRTTKEQRLRSLGLLGAHYGMLATISTHPALAGASLARRLGVTPQAVASLAARLEKQGLLERRPHPRHPHIHEWRLTGAGVGVLSAADELVAGLDAQIVAEFAGQDAEELRRLLERVVEIVDGVEPD